MQWFSWSFFSPLRRALLLICLVQTATTTAGPLQPAPPFLPGTHLPDGNGTVEALPRGRSGDDAPPQRLVDSIFLRYGASDDFFSSSFNTSSSSSNCLAQPGAYTADPEPPFDCRQDPFAWESGGVVQIRCPGPIRWIQEGHELLVNQGFAKANVEKDSPVWERRNRRAAWHSGRPRQLRHTTEFLEVRCGKQLQQFVRLRPRPAVAARVPPPPLAGRRRPDVVVLAVDTVSRASFMRLCTKTAALLQSFALAGAQASHRAFVFPRAAALGPSTAWNMVPLFAGLPHSLAAERMREKTGVIGALPPGRRWLWDEARAAGYATAYVSQFCCLVGYRFWNNSFDHLMPSRIPYSRMARFLIRGNVCLAGQSFVDLDFNYTHAFLEEPLYASVPKFLYAHFDHAHERETRAAWLDAPIATAVQRILRTQPNSVVLLLSDHGGTPKHLPLFSLLVPSPLLQAMPQWGSSLHNNQAEVVSWYDLHLTLRHLLNPDHPPPTLPTLRTAQSLLTPLFGAEPVSQVDPGPDRTQSEPNDATGGTNSPRCLVPKVARSATMRAPQHPGRRARRPPAGLSHAPPCRAPVEPLAMVEEPLATVEEPGGRSCRAAGVPAAFCPCARAAPLAPGSPALAGAVAALLAEWNGLIPAGSSCLLLVLDRVISAQEMIPSGPADTVQHFDLQFTVKGDPYPVFALRSDLDRRTGHYTLVSATQETRYERYRQCADPQVEITYCICKTPSSTVSSNITNRS